MVMSLVVALSVTQVAAQQFADNSRFCAEALHDLDIVVVLALTAPIRRSEGELVPDDCLV